MDQETVKQKMSLLINVCPCGSGKFFYDCCGKEKAMEIANESCPCGSGKLVKDCCMKSSETR